MSFYRHLHKAVLFPLFFSCGFHIALAQKPSGITATIGESYNYPKNFTQAGNIHLPSGGYLQLSQKNSKILNIQRIDGRSRIIKENSIELKDYPDYVTTQGLVSTAGKIYWVYAGNNQFRDPMQLFAREIDTTNCTLTNHNIPLSDSMYLSNVHSYRRDHQKTPFDKRSLENIQSIRIVTSPDKSKILIVADVYDDELRDHRFTFMVFDDQFNALWSKKVLTKTGDDRAVYRPFIVDNTGNAYTTLGTFNNMSPKFWAVADYFELIKVEKDGKQTAVKILSPGKIVSDAIIANGRDGNILVGGCYDNKSDYATEGLFVYRLNNGNNTLEKLSENNQYSFTHLKVNENNDGKATKMRMLKIEEDTDGGIYLFAEENSVTRGGNGLVSDAVLGGLSRFDDLVIAAINPDGTKRWITGVPKKQQGIKNPGGLSVSTAFYKGDCYIYYMDNGKNSNRLLGDELVQHLDPSGGHLTVAKISKDGEMTRSILLTPEEFDGNCQFSKTLLNENGQLVLLGYSSGYNDPELKDMKLVTISIE